MATKLNPHVNHRDKITDRRIHYGVLKRASVADFAVETHGSNNWKTKVHAFMDRSSVQIILHSLLILDVLIIFAELFLMSEYPSCRLVERDCQACCPKSHDDDAHGNERWLEGGDYHSEEICESGYESTGSAACDSHKYETVHIIEACFFYCTVTILVIFLIENIIEMIVLGPMNYFRQVFLVFDLFVVVVSLTLELVLHQLKKNYAEVISILVLFRLWRFVRIGHGIVEVASEVAHKQYDPLLEYVRECEKKLDANNITKPESSRKVQELMDYDSAHAM
mmetsp:Transcript_15411/g.31605  ORF Transcript_15411/g.31605 Transcript_15411/m.31605 type:complete len:280 (+) Transcript_15411:201-1040(+)|eukprot:CAMPEP_0201135370 /NCGR_PEP_ID=MMETSP0850-20130426/54279_1 /ASSEMBLY_ACC=CAM_ASM_000622 /TAXON_ID=183588 /ORGANISM="Pseudo-nitzschia fraudulenta, Strain WWA7" /LENGTH=279 /DNA_ID=CAMNT_0047406531 /DNA_START=297 /DNA_END=1136 /DNA_ORIENTATION=-